MVKRTAPYTLEEIKDKQFGTWIVIGSNFVRDSNNNKAILCKCSKCGNESIIRTCYLVYYTNGKACKACYKKDITGMRFGKLEVMHIIDDRKYFWHCKCDCGNEIDTRIDRLVKGETTSCGCNRRPIGQYTMSIDNTQVLALNSKMYSNNKSGYKGVYYDQSRDMYKAEIGFNKKVYFLGYYSDLLDAANARKKAEDVLFRPTEVFYKRYHEKADADPEWAKANPPKIKVTKIGIGKDSQFKVKFSPEL